MSDIGYDDLHRLTGLSSAGQGAMAFSYNSIGNITANGEGAGSYSYHPAKPTPSSPPTAKATPTTPAAT